MFLLAIKYNNEKIVHYLLKQGLSPNFCDDYLRTPIHYAVENDNAEILKLLLDYKADPDVCDDDIEYPLVVAIKENKIEIVKTLCEYDINLSLVEEFELLHFAVKYSYMEIVKVLIQNGADRDLLDEDGCLPIHYAETENIIRYIQSIKENSKYNAKSIYGSEKIYL